MVKKNNVKVYPDKSLEIPTIKWDFSIAKESLQSVIDLLEEELERHPEGVALAANQIGLSGRIFLIEKETAAKFDIPRVIINPILKNITESEKKEVKEGCLSFPGIFVKIKRHDSISCEYNDIDGIRKVIFLEGYPARIFQHECDHLDGKLILDRVTRIQKYQIISEMKKRK